MSTNKVSFIVSTLNSGKTLQACFNSIICQKHENFEIIVIDGKSEDDTLEIINNYRKYIAYFISEKDSGIYDAWNKALKYTTGEWLCFVGSDDFVLENGIVNMLSLLEVDNKANFISAKVLLVDENCNDIQVIGRPWDFNYLKNGLGIVHCGALHSKSLFIKDRFDSKYKIAGDYEFLLRIGEEIESLFLDQVIVKMYFGGASRKHLNKVIFETYYALKVSNKFPKIYSVLYFVNAHLREFVKSKLQFLLGEPRYNRLKFLFSSK